MSTDRYRREFSERVIRVAEAGAPYRPAPPVDPFVDLKDAIDTLRAVVQQHVHELKENDEDTVRQDLNSYLYATAHHLLFQLNDLAELRGGRKFKIEEIQWKYSPPTPR